MPLIHVAYGTTTPEQALACPQCYGTGRFHVVWKTNWSRFENCSRCDSSGINPRPILYPYLVDEHVAVGDLVELEPSSWSPARLGTVVRLSDSHGPYRHAWPLHQEV